jgi:signal transduction histidine kinase
MDFRWEPSVRTRHLAVIIALSLVAVGTITSINLSRLVTLRIQDKARSHQALADALFQIAQPEILNSPQADALTLLSGNKSVQTMMTVTTGPEKDFSYVALISFEGKLLVKADPEGKLESGATPEPFEKLSTASAPRPLFIVLFTDREYQMRTSIKLGSQPFADVIAGISTVELRHALRTPLLLGVILALSVVGFVLLVAVFSSPFVLKPLREVLKSIDQLEAEIAVQGETADKHAIDPNSMTQRLRVLGRRFAGNRNELEVTRDQLRQVIGSLSESVVLLDRDQRILLASPEAERILSGGRGLERGKPLGDSLGPEHPLSELTSRAFASRESLQEVTSITSNGDEPQKIFSAVQIFEDRGRAVGALLALRDFDTLERLESQLDFANKVTALNRITAGVAHEVKNPLHAMVLHLELLNAKLASGGDPQAHVDVLVNEVNRLNRVVQTFLDFNRPVQLHPHLVDATTLIKEVLPLGTDGRGQEIEIVERYTDQPLEVNVDVDLIKQALLNMVINACQAMPEGGKLTATTSRFNENHVQITIADEGPGIPPELREKVFNLYFTTKSHGSGIGLAQAFRAIQLHNGRIELDSKAGQGATFRIILPAA